MYISYTYACNYMILYVCIHSHHSTVWLKATSQHCKDTREAKRKGNIPHPRKTNM